MPISSGADTPLLIDTHYWLWLQFGIRERLTAQNLDRIKRAADQGRLFLSVMSVWEVAMLESKGRVQLYKDCALWVEEALATPGLTLAPVTPAIAIESSRLPGNLHPDPADRIIIATARALGARLLTSDRNILAYGRKGHVLLA